MSAQFSKEVRQLRKKVVFADYIESGSFQGGEEDVFLAGIEYNEECAVMSKKTLERLSTLASDAAAPDLLAALKAVLPTLDDATADANFKAGTGTIEQRQKWAAVTLAYRSEADAARAAIAKAEGKQ